MDTRIRCYIGNGTGIRPKRFTCYRGDRAGYTDECMKSYDEYRQVALDTLKEYKDIGTVEEFVRLKWENERLRAERDAANETIRKVEDRLKVIFGAKEYVKPGTGIYLTTKVALEYIKERRGLEGNDG